jgi:subtilase family serine protease
VQALEGRLMLSAASHQAVASAMKTLKGDGLGFPVEVHYAPNHHAPVAQSGSSRTKADAGLTSPYGGITPAQMRGAYGITGISFSGISGTGAGETIAILDPGDDTGLVNSTSSSFSSSDLAIFDSYYGLPTPPSFIKEGFTDPTSGTPALTTTLPTSNGTNGNDLEISLDVEWAHAMAPQANILLVEGKSNFSDIFNGVLAIDAVAASMNICALSMSFGGAEDGNLSSTANAEGVDGAYFDTPGLVYLASSGDTGAYASGTSTITSQFPASSSNVLAVGGTTLSVSSSNTYVGETTWGNGTSSGTSGGGGGGLSVYEPQPAYQVGKVNGLTTSARAYPDISLDASGNSGVPVYDSPDYGTGTGWVPGEVYGTSLASPLMAGIVAIADQGRSLNGFAALNSSGGSGVANSNPNGNASALDIHTMLYGFGYSNSDFHDITSGNSIGPANYGPGVGYDLSTGIGSPVANRVAADLSSSSAIALAVTTQPVNHTVAAGTAVSFTAAATGTPNPTVQWQYSSNNGVSYSTISGAISTTYSFTPTGYQTAYMYRAVFTNSVGSVATIAATLTVTRTATSTALKSNNASPTYGQSVTFTATVTPASGSGETGTVQFVINGANVGSPVNLSSNTATYTTTSLSGGGDSVMAVYSGDGYFSGSTSTPLTQPVTKATPTVTWGTPAAITYGTALTASQLNASASVAGSYSYTPAAGMILNAGTQPLSVLFTPTDTTDYNTQTASVNLVVNKAVLKVTAANLSKTYGSANPSLTDTITGFVNGDTVSVVSGSANLSTSATSSSAAGTYPITAAAGTLSAANYTFTFVNGVLTVTQAGTTVAVSSGNASPTYGQSVTFTATVSPLSGTGETGTVQFVIDGSNAGSPVALANNGTATYTTSSLAVGSHTILASYRGDSNFQSSQSVQISQAVLPGWLSVSSGANVLWTQSAQTLQVSSGTATIIADPEESQFNSGAGDDPVITVTGSGTKLEIAPTDGSLLVHIGGLTLNSGAVADVASLGAARAHSNHRVLVIGTVNQATAPTFSIDSTSKLDLEDNDMIVHGGNDGSSDFAVVHALAMTGRNGTVGGFLDGTWTGDGLTSSVAAAEARAEGQEYTALAVVQNGELPLGQYSSWTVGSASEPLRSDGNDVIVKYTYIGDWALEGAVNTDANTIFDADYGRSLPFTWANGSYNEGPLNTDANTVFDAYYNNGVTRGPQL